MRKRIVAIIVLLVMLLGACGRQKTTDQKGPTPAAGESESEETRWKLEETRLPDGKEALMEILPEGAGEPSQLMLGMRGDTLYRIAHIYGEELKATCIQKLEAPYTQWESVVVPDDEWMEGISCHAQYASLGADGVQLLLKEPGDDGGWYWAEWTEDKGGSAESIVSVHIGKDFFQDIRDFYKTPDGTVYFAKAGGVQYFDETFQEKKEWVDSGDVWQFVKMAGEEGAEGGKMYLFGSTIDGKFRIWTVEGREPVAASDEVFMSFDSRVVLADKQEGYLCTPHGIWQFSMPDSPDGGKMENLLMFGKEGYPVERVYGASVNKEGNLLMTVLADGEYLLLERKVDEDWQDKKELELVTMYANAFLKKAVADFNRQSDEYYIVLIEKDEEENWLDFQTRIRVEIGSGGGPALVTDDIVNLYDGAKNGYLMNLTEELAEERERIPENVWASGEVEGECFGAPYTFYADTLVVSEDVAEGREYWTTEDFMECVKNSGAEAAITRVDGAWLFWILMSQGNLIDWDAGKSYMDSKEAVELLEFAGTYGADDTVEDSYPRVLEGRTLAASAAVDRLGSSMGCAYEAMFQGKAVYIGYPTDNYPEQNGSILWSLKLMVNQNCEYPEGAVAFIRFLLSEETQRKLAKKTCEENVYDLPVDAEALEYAFRYAKELSDKKEPSYAAVNGFEFTNGPVSEESWAKLQKVILSASPQAAYAGEVETIVFEEVGAYLAGARTAKETCDIMQNRIQLYLNEIQ